MYDSNFKIIGILMVVFIGTVPAIALSDGADNTVRYGVNQGLTIAAAAKHVVKDNIKKGETDLSRGWIAQYLKKLNPTVDSVKIDPSTGKISISFSEQTKNIGITLTPSVAGKNIMVGNTSPDDVNWRCTVSDVGYNKYVPSDCRN